MTFKPSPACNCGRSTCGLLTGKLDDIDLENIWLPVWFLNHIKGCVFLEMKKGDQPEFENRAEATRVYLKNIRAGNVRRNLNGKS